MEIVGEDLVGSKFTLTPFKEEHITPQYLGWLNDKEVNKYLEVRFVHQTHETALAFVSSFYGGEEKYFWSISPNGVDEQIGTMTLYVIDRNHRSCEIGILIGETGQWGKGASNEVIDTVLDFSFNTLDLHRATGRSNSSNLGMNFTLKRLGFTLEGKLREACFLGDGKYIDDYRWGILSHEWEARRQAEKSSSE